MKAIVFPGQGSQYKGMGADLFDLFPEMVKTANRILGYNIVDLCLKDQFNELSNTAFTQPAIYVVSVLGYKDYLGRIDPPDYLVGHSIGEYAALALAGVFDFETGLRIVQKRAALMAQISGGKLAAIIGLSFEEVLQRINESGLKGIEIANINSPDQIVIGGTEGTLQQFITFCSGQHGRIIPLQVSGAFHTSQMHSIQKEFQVVLGDFIFQDPLIPVISNFTAEPHDVKEIVNNLSSHLVNPVQWVKCIEKLLAIGVSEFVEIGRSQVLTPMIDKIRSRYTTFMSYGNTRFFQGNRHQDFCHKFCCMNPFIVGSLGHGISGVELVSELARHGILAFLDTEGLELNTVDEALSQLSTDPRTLGKFGVGLTYNIDNFDIEEQLVDMFLRYSVRYIEAQGYPEPSSALLRYRSGGGVDKDVCSFNRIIVKITDDVQAESFLQIPEYSSGFSDKIELNFLRNTPVADALYIDPLNKNNSAGLFTNMLAKRNAFLLHNPNAQHVFIGSKGGCTVPTATQKLLSQGTDFVVSGSEFLTVKEAQLSAIVKQKLRTCSDEQFREIHDWKFPELASMSLCYVEHNDVEQQLQSFQKLYLEGQFTVNSLRDITDIQHYLLDEIFFNEYKAMGDISTIDARYMLRNTLRDALQKKSIPCDSSLVEFNAWLENQGVESLKCIDAIHLVNLLYPDFNIHRSTIKE